MDACSVDSHTARDDSSIDSNSSGGIDGDIDVRRSEAKIVDWLERAAVPGSVSALALQAGVALLPVAQRQASTMLAPRLAVPCLGLSAVELEVADRHFVGLGLGLPSEPRAADPLCLLVVLVCASRRVFELWVMSGE